MEKYRNNDFVLYSYDYLMVTEYEKSVGIIENFNLVYSNDDFELYKVSTS